MKKLFILMLCIVLLVGTISAFEFDNAGRYDEETKTITIVNALGLGDDISRIELLSPIRNIVDLGYTEIARLELTNLKDYDNAFKELELFDKKDNDRKFTRDYDYKVLSYEEITVDDYGLVLVETTKNGTKHYGNRIVGSHKETKEKWTDLGIANFKAGEVLTIGIFTEVYKGDYVEWIGNYFGVRVDEWASFEPGPFSVRATGFSADVLQGGLPANVTNGINITTGSGNPKFIRKVVKLAGGTEEYATIQGINNSEFLAFALFVGDTATFDNYSLEPDTVYLIGVTNFSGAYATQRDGSVSYPINLTEVQVTSGKNGVSSDSSRGWAFVSLELAEGILTPGPLITLNAPPDNLKTTNQTITFNASILSDLVNTIVNVSLILDGIVNETNSSGINNSDYLFTKIVSFDSHNWTYESCDNESFCNIATVRNFNVSTFIENNFTFNSTPRETSLQDFEVNITTIPSILSVSAFLNYEGARFLSQTSCDGLDCSITNTIDIPLITTGQFQNESFFWEISVFDGSSSVSLNTSTNQQNVTRINLESCGGAFTTQALNFTAFDEQNLTRIDPFLFDATFDQWLGSGTVKRESDFTDTSIDEVTLCILPADEEYFIDAIIEYDEAENTTNIYTLRNYYFQNDTINSSSQDIFLFLLEESSSTSFILKVQDDSLLPVQGVLIEINRFYPGTNEFRIVQIARTDDLGKSVGFFETEIVDYKFFITRNNSILLETGLQKVIPETSPFTLTFNIGEPLGEPWKTQDVITDLTSSLLFNQSSLIVTYIYIDTSNDLNLARLFVIRQSLTNSSADITLCNENSTLSSATLTCNTTTTGGFYIASSFITRENIEELDLQISFNIETLSAVVGLLGLFFGWFLILIASFMFRFNVVAGIWAMTTTVFLINLMGLISFGSVFVTATIATAVILTWIMER